MDFIEDESKGIFNILQKIFECQERKVSYIKLRQN
jgi:hypothetical protein